MGEESEQRAQKYAETFMGSHGAPVEHFVDTSQERQAQMSQIFFEASQELVDRVRRGQEVGRVFTQGTASVYADFTTPYSSTTGRTLGCPKI